MKKTWVWGGALSATLGLAVTAWATTTQASADAGRMAPTMSASATKDITARKNSRLHKCDEMTGDEKKACKADAATHARAAKQKVAEPHASTTKG